jgi:Glycosyltransferase family 10 (fucosyltransferase) C-term
MIKVKVTHPYGNWPLARQTPNNSGIWGECQFFINDDTKECDYWFVIDNLYKEESVISNPKNTIIITLEFPEIRPEINIKFLKQFDTVLTYSRQINHPKTVDIIAPFPWHIGINTTNIDTIANNYKNYDDFKMCSIADKPKLISVVSSNKKYIEGHRKRLIFVDALKDYFGERIDIFGRGINDFADKWDVIVPYKYHISIENSSCENGISEKLYDSFLGEAFPFYYGCSNTREYFPVESFVSIDINEIDKSIKIIESSISNQIYEKSVRHIRDAKCLILDKYNIFNLMNNYCINNPKKNNYKYTVRIKPESHFVETKLDTIKKVLRRFF